MKMMEGQTTLPRMMMRMERATGWNLENHSSRQKIRTTVHHYLKIHCLERAAVLNPQTEMMEGPPKTLKQAAKARGGIKEMKNGFLTL